jgi:hypothetical protein
MPDFSTILQAPDIRALVQENILERAFHDALFPRLLFRGDASPQLWPANIGDTMVFTGVGLIKPKLKPLTPGADPLVSDYQKEQWTAQLQQYADSIDTHMPTSIVAIANLFLRNTHQMGMSAGQTLNRLVRNAMYKAALSGQTVADGAQGPTNTIRVARLNGFTRARRPDLISGSAVKFDLVSANNPLPIVVNAPGATARNVVAFAADFPGDECGPGTITLDGAAISVVDRALVKANDATVITRVGGGTRIDDITAANTLQLRDIRSAVSRMWQENVPEHSDARFHCHLDPTSQSEVFNDPEWQRLLTSLPDYFMYQQFAIGQMLGAAFFRNSECPLPETVSGAPTSYVAPSASFSENDPFCGELINPTGVVIHRALFSGQGGILEYYQDLNQLVTEAGIVGKVGAASINNNGIEVFTDRIQLIIRAPLNRLQDSVATSWKFIGDWPLRTDAVSGDTARYKRFVAIEHG